MHWDQMYSMYKKVDIILIHTYILNPHLHMKMIIVLAVKVREFVNLLATSMICIVIHLHFNQMVQPGTVGIVTKKNRLQSVPELPVLKYCIEAWYTDMRVSETTCTVGSDAVQSGIIDYCVVEPTKQLYNVCRREGFIRHNMCTFPELLYLHSRILSADIHTYSTYR
jgi:hypothetical protein